MKPELGPLSPDFGPRERAYVYSVAMKYVKDEVAADDVTQEALLLAFRYRDSFRGDARFSTWLYRVTATAALMYLRKQKRLSRERPLLTGPSEEPGEEMPIDLPDSAPSPAEQLAAREALELVDQELGALGKSYRDVFWRKFAEGYSEPELAELEGVSLSAIKSRTYRARHAVCGALAHKLAA
jgi:RNA polymerase sigma-70 factor (ECF subfamily)